MTNIIESPAATKTPPQSNQENIHDQSVIILDFGSQFTQLIARRVREIGVFCEILPFDVPAEEIRRIAPRGIILSGGHESVTGSTTPRAPNVVFELGCPVLGICYGMQTMAAQLGGEVEMADHSEFGAAKVDIIGSSSLFEEIEDHVSAENTPVLDVWMSHGDKVTRLPSGFATVARSANCPIAAMADNERQFYGIQFHPEVTHTRQGARIIQRFLQEICGCDNRWQPQNIITDRIQQIQNQVGKDGVLLGLSGGVDSSVVAVLLHKAIGQ